MQQGKWVFDFSHSKIGFRVRHFGITETDGQFRKFRGNVLTAKEDFSDVQMELFIEVNSVDTNDSQRDAHLRSADFLDAEKFPEINFKSTRLDRVGEAQYKLYGELNIKGITKPVELDMEFTGLVLKDPFGNSKAGFHVSGEINRKDWDVTWNVALDHGGVAVSDTVRIFCPIQLLKV